MRRGEGTERIERMEREHQWVEEEVWSWGWWERGRE